MPFKTIFLKNYLHTYDKHFIVLRYITLFVHLFVIVLTFTELNCYSHCSRVAFLELFWQICFKEVLSFKTFYDMQFSILISVSWEHVVICWCWVDHQLLYVCLNQYKLRTCSDLLMLSGSPVIICLNQYKLRTCSGLLKLSGSPVIISLFESV